MKARYHANSTKKHHARKQLEPSMCCATKCVYSALVRSKHRLIHALVRKQKMRQQQQRTRQIIIQSSRRGRGARPTLILFLGARAPRPRRARKTNKSHSNQENQLYTIGGLFLFICLLQIGTGARGARHKQTQSPNVLTWGCTNANVQDKNANARVQNKHAKLRVFVVKKHAYVLRNQMCI